MRGGRWSWQPAGCGARCANRRWRNRLPDAGGVRKSAASSESCAGRRICWNSAHFQHDVILVQLREYGGDLPLAVGVVEGLVDRGRRDAEARGRVAVDHQRGLQALRPAGRWPRRAVRAALASLSSMRGAQVFSSSAFGVFQRVLELRAADAVFHGQVLHRLHEQRDAGHLGQLRLQAANHLGGADASRSSSGFRLI